MKNIKLKTKSIKISESLTSFIKEQILNKTKVLMVIGLVVATLIISMLYSSDINLSNESDTTLLYVLKQKVIILVLILLSGWVPYFYIPAISYIAYIFMLSGDIISVMGSNNTIVALLMNILPCAIDIFTTSVITAIGIYMCSYSSKKYKYATRTSFSFLDLKIHFYEIKKNEEKVNELARKKEEKIKEMENNNVKIDYRQIIKVFPAMVIINLLITVLQYYIN